MMRRAQGSSSLGAVGRHVKTARRVGLSETPGDLERPHDDEVAQVGKGGDAVADADLGVGQRMVDRLDQVVLGPFELAG